MSTLVCLKDGGAYLDNVVTQSVEFLRRRLKVTVGDQPFSDDEVQRPVVTAPKAMLPGLTHRLHKIAVEHHFHRVDRIESPQGLNSGLKLGVSPDVRRPRWRRRAAKRDQQGLARLTRGSWTKRSGGTATFAIVTRSSTILAMSSLVIDPPATIAHK